MINYMNIIFLDMFKRQIKATSVVDCSTAQYSAKSHHASTIRSQSQATVKHAHSRAHLFAHRKRVQVAVTKLYKASSHFNIDLATNKRTPTYAPISARKNKKIMAKSSAAPTPERLPPPKPAGRRLENAKHYFQRRTRCHRQDELLQT